MGRVIPGRSGVRLKTRYYCVALAPRHFDVCVSGAGST